ncbi:hypothetical protein [Nostoc sp. WHI]|uniref:hypothetical protein n=1 Tax=Nostoc sp. WHI TaxID=2650611 RepID=UPI0018C587BE|nr:hypothetical protein [Nostoc sp. WHI]MBG1269287.1 hypothetical protein [Nostoc sp. WHI]
MSSQDLKSQVYKLSVSDRLELLSAIVHSLQNDLRPRSPVPEYIVDRITGLLKTNTTPPTDAEVEVILD